MYQLPHFNHGCCMSYRSHIVMIITYLCQLRSYAGFRPNMAVIVYNQSKYGILLVILNDNVKTFLLLLWYVKHETHHTIRLQDSTQIDIKCSYRQIPNVQHNCALLMNITGEKWLPKNCQ